MEAFTTLTAVAAPLAEGQGFLKRASTLFGLLGDGESK